jgi:hypothetical protein
MPGEAYIDYGPPLPDGYGLLTIHALVRDPRAVFAYWEWPAPDEGRAWAVRLRDVEAATTSVMKLDRAAAALGTRHFEAQPDRPYEVDLGWTDGAAFHAVATSNRVRTPRERPATDIDDAWPPGPGESEVLGGLAAHPPSRGYWRPGASHA